MRHIIFYAALLTHMKYDLYTYLQEKLLREKIQLEQNVALFEQRKIASREELQYAEDRIFVSQQMNAKVQAEIDKLVELSEFVTKKDAEASEKLAEANLLYAKAQELEAACISDADAIEQQKRHLEREKQLLLEERVSVLKKRSLNRELGSSVVPSYSTKVLQRKDNNMTSESDLMLKNRLTAIKSQLKRLKE